MIYKDGSCRLIFLFFCFYAARPHFKYVQSPSAGFRKTAAKVLNWFLFEGYIHFFGPVYVWCVLDFVVLIFR